MRGNNRKKSRKTYHTPHFLLNTPTKFQRGIKFRFRDKKLTAQRVLVQAYVQEERISFENPPPLRPSCIRQLHATDVTCLFVCLFLFWVYPAWYGPHNRVLGGQGERVWAGACFSEGIGW